MPKTDDHLPALRRLFAAERWAMLAPLPWDDAQKAALLDSQFAMQHQQYRQQYGAARFLVLATDDGAIGRFYVGERDGRLWIVDILLHPDWRGQGLGAALILALQGHGRAISLHVDKGNPARMLYQRLGFCVTGDTGVSWRMDWDGGGSQIAGL